MFVAAASLIFTTSCKKEDNTSTNTGPGNIVKVTQGEDDLSIFAEAISKADLNSKLSSGNYTVFAPTDNVFQAYLSDLGVNDIDGYISVYGKAQLKTILLYHIHDGAMKGDEISDGYIKSEATNSNGDKLDMFINTSGSISINKDGTSGATITEMDLKASNGYIHKIDAVLTPLTISGLLKVNNDFSYFLEACSKSSGDLITALGNEGANFTLMAPNNAAFNSLFGEMSNINNVDDMVTEYGLTGLANILNYHCILGYKRAESLSTGSYNTRLQNEMMDITNSGGNIQITDGQNRKANVIIRNITGVNGMINSITIVLLVN